MMCIAFCKGVKLSLVVNFVSSSSVYSIGKVKEMGKEYQGFGFAFLEIVKKQI
jgi:hypothetical protein